VRQDRHGAPVTDIGQDLVLQPRQGPAIAIGRAHRRVHEHRAIAEVGDVVTPRAMAERLAERAGRAEAGVGEQQVCARERHVLPQVGQERRVARHHGRIVRPGKVAAAAADAAGTATGELGAARLSDAWENRDRERGQTQQCDDATHAPLLLA
jgi:hypothetical protein